jgi:holliday junction resolvase YEN1
VNILVQSLDHWIDCLLPSIWLVECQIPFRRHHAQHGANPELRTLFFRLARYLQFPVTLIFIFDGEGRPPVKRGKKVIKTDHWLSTRVQEMLTLFGFRWYKVSKYVIYYVDRC